MQLYDYKQSSKNIVRHTILSHAVNCLTVDRQNSSCVHRTYVRNVFDYFISLDEDEPALNEAKKVDANFISAWESLHDSVIGYKRPSDLSVCYLSGPQPENDFNELVSLGILPQNIWAFEKDMDTYLEAVSSYDSPTFPQPKIVKMPVEQFFKQSPKKFDIVYIDACGSIPSSQHALRNIATLFQYQRLNSPGALITNFSKPDITKSNVCRQYSALIALYHIFKNNPNATINLSNNKIHITGMDDLDKLIKKDFSTYYGDFLSCLLSDIPALIIPLQRFSSIAPYSNLFYDMSQRWHPLTTDLDEINQVCYNSICKFLLAIDYIKSQGLECHLLKALCIDILGLNGDFQQLIRGVKAFIGLKNGTINIDSRIGKIKLFFEGTNNLYQFLDRPTVNLFYDMVINQLAYPLHTNVECCKRYQYCAKATDMFTDLIILDECRYIYEWLPAIHQIENAMKNISWQYIFRFALDGLVKQRLNYNNEFFFQGSVISQNEANFNAKKKNERIIIRN